MIDLEKLATAFYAKCNFGTCWISCLHTHRHDIDFMTAAVVRYSDVLTAKRFEFNVDKEPQWTPSPRMTCWRS